MPFFVAQHKRECCFDEITVLKEKSFEANSLCMTILLTPCCAYEREKVDRRMDGGVKGNVLLITAFR